MSRPPKDINEPFFGARKIFFSCMQGVGILIVTLLIYFIGIRMGYSEKAVRTLTFVTLIVSNIAAILSNRSWTSNFFRILITPNTAVKWIVGGAVVFLILILNVPFLINLFQFEKLRFIELIVCTVAGFSSIIWFEIYKQVKKSLILRLIIKVLSGVGKYKDITGSQAKALITLTGHISLFW